MSIAAIVSIIEDMMNQQAAIAEMVAPLPPSETHLYCRRERRRHSAALRQTIAWIISPEAKLTQSAADG